MMRHNLGHSSVCAQYTFVDDWDKKAFFHRICSFAKLLSCGIVKIAKGTSIKKLHVFEALCEKNIKYRTRGIITRFCF